MRRRPRCRKERAILSAKCIAPGEGVTGLHWPIVVLSISFILAWISPGRAECGTVSLDGVFAALQRRRIAGRVFGLFD